MSIKHRASTTQRMCEMAYMGRLQTTVIARSEATKQSIFAAPWIASPSLSSGAHSRDPLARNDGETSACVALPSAAHEIEIAALVGLQNGLVEQMRVAAPGPFGRRDGRKRRTALFQFLDVDQKIDASLADIEPDHVAVLDQRQRAADRGFRRDVQHDGAKGSAAHPRIRDPHHVLDAAARQPPRN